MISQESHKHLYWFTPTSTYRNWMIKVKKNTVSSVNQDMLLSSTLTSIMKAINIRSRPFWWKHSCLIPTSTPVWLRCASTDKSKTKTTISSCVPKLSTSAQRKVSNVDGRAKIWKVNFMSETREHSKLCTAVSWCHHRNTKSLWPSRLTLRPQRNNSFYQVSLQLIRRRKTVLTTFYRHLEITEITPRSFSKSKSILMLHKKRDQRS